MKCKQFLLLASDYIDGTLSSIDIQKLEQHLTECQRCKIFVNTLKATISLYQSLSEIPTSVHQTLHRTIREHWEVHKVEVSVGTPKFPFVEIMESENKITVSILLPGVKKEDLTLTVAQDYIELSGINRKPDGIYYFNEIKYGPFSRKLKLPSLIDSSKTEAHLENGILKILLFKV